MYSKKRNKFYIIDWGIFKIKSSCLDSIKSKKEKAKTHKMIINVINLHLLM